MTSMETQVEALNRLRREGYTTDLSLGEDGRLTASESRTAGVDDPRVDGGVDIGLDTIAVDAVVRFEGISNPDDEAMMLAVTCDDGTQGVLTLPYGPSVSGPQADAIRHLVLRRR